MARARIQGVANTSAVDVTTFSITLSAAPTLGNLVCVSFQGTNTTALTVADGNSNAYTVTPNSPFNHLGQKWWLAYLLSAPSNASATITAQWTTPVAPFMSADEFSGGPFAFDNDVTGFGNTGTNCNDPTITPTNANSLAYACCVSQLAITAPATGGTLNGWTGGAIDAGHVNFGVEYDLSLTGAQAVSFTQTNNQIWTSMAMAFFNSQIDEDYYVSPSPLLTVPQVTVWQ